MNCHHQRLQGVGCRLTFEWDGPTARRQSAQHRIMLQPGQPTLLSCQECTFLGWGVGGQPGTVPWVAGRLCSAHQTEALECPSQAVPCLPVTLPPLQGAHCQGQCSAPKQAHHILFEEHQPSRRRSSPCRRLVHRSAALCGPLKSLPCAALPAEDSLSQGQRPERRLPGWAGHPPAVERPQDDHPLRDAPAGADAQQRARTLQVGCLR